MSKLRTIAIVATIGSGCLAAGLAAGSGMPAPVGRDSAACYVLSNNSIRVEASGTAELDFDTALAKFQQADILSEVEAEYARQLEPGEEPEFSIQHTETNVYSYVNRKNQKSVVRELFRGSRASDTLDVVYHVRGRRFFGDFQALIHVAVTNSAGAEVAYEVDVYAYPENGFYRFLANLRPIRSFFRRKTSDVMETALNICKGLCAASVTPEPNRPAAGPDPD